MTLIGTIAVDRFTLVDAEGAYITLETFAADASFGPDTIDWLVTELADGLYELAVTIPVRGSYYLRLLGGGSGQIHEFTTVADDYEVGDTITDYFTILDSDGAYVTGATLTVDATYDPSGTTFGPTTAEIGSGLYSISWGADSAGAYTARVIATLDPPEEPQLFEFEHIVVVPVAVSSPFATPIGTTLEDLIQGVAVACHDYKLVIATSDAADGATWPDRRRLGARAAKTFKGSLLYVLEAAVSANVGQEAYVIDSVSGALQLDVPLPGAVRVGDRGYVTNLESVGFDRDTYIFQLNSRIKSSFPFALRDAAWTFTDVLDAEAPYLTPPEDFTHISVVSFPLYSGSMPTLIPFTEYGDGDGWFWDAANDRLQINSPYRDAAHNAYLSIRGYGRWEDLVDGSDVTGVDYEWLVDAAAGMLILSTGDPRRQSEAAMHFNRADALRIKASTSVMPNTVQIRP
jgi:hypothetical protein